MVGYFDKITFKGTRWAKPRKGCGKKIVKTPKRALFSLEIN